VKKEFGLAEEWVGRKNSLLVKEEGEHTDTNGVVAVVVTEAGSKGCGFSLPLLVFQIVRRDCFRAAETTIV